MNIRTQDNSMRRYTADTVEKEPPTINFLNERLSKFLNDNAVPGEEINAILQRADDSRDSIYTADRNIQLNEAEAEYVLLHFPEDHLKYRKLNQEFVNDIPNVELAAELSDYISSEFDFDDDKIAEILGIEYLYDDDNVIRIPEAQVANITGKQWLNFRQWVNSYRSEEGQEPEGFDEAFGHHKIVQDKINQEELINLAGRESSNVAGIQNTAAIQNNELVEKLPEDIKSSNSVSDELPQIASASERKEYERIQKLHEEQLKVLNTGIVNKALKIIAQNKKRKFSWEQKNELQSKVAAVLDTLDEEYIKLNQAALVSNIVDNLSRSTESNWFRKSLKISDKKVDQYLTQFIPVVTTKNTEFVTRHLKDELFKHKIPEPELARRLSKYLINTLDQHGNFGSTVLTQDETKKYSFEQLADLRKHNPRIFDKILFAQEDLAKNAAINSVGQKELDRLSQKGDLTKSSAAFATDILASVVKKYEGKIATREGEKIFNKLHGVLSNFDSQYLANHQLQFINEITTSLSQYGDINKRHQQFNISSKGLTKVSGLIEKDHLQANRQFIDQEIAEGKKCFESNLLKHQVANTQLYNRAATFLATNNMQEVIEREKLLRPEQLRALKKLTQSLKDPQEQNNIDILKNLDISTEQLVRIRRLDPHLFDSTIFLSQDIANIENRKKEMKEKFLQDFEVKEGSFVKVKEGMVNEFSTQKLKGYSVHRINSPGDPKMERIEAQSAARRAQGTARLSSDDTESMVVPPFLRSSFNSMSESLTSARHSINSNSSCYNSDSSIQGESQSIIFNTSGNNVPSSPILKADNNQRYSNNSLARSSSTDSGLGELSSRASSDSIYENLPWTGSPSMAPDLGFGSQEKLAIREARDSKSASISSITPSNLSGSDSAYGSQEDIGREKNDLIAKVVQDKLQDIKRLPNKLYSYKAVQLQHASKDMRPVVCNEGVLSILELTAPLFRDHLFDDTIITDLFREVKSNAENLINLPTDVKIKTNWQLAKLEASLKGYVLPTVVRSKVPVGSEDPPPIKALNSVLLDLQGKSIPKKEYASTVIDKTMEVLCNDTSFSPTQLAEFEALIQQGDKTKKMDKVSSSLNEKQHAELANAANEAMKAFMKELPFNRRGAFSPEIKNTAKMFIFEANKRNPEDLLKIQGCMDMIDMPDGLLYGLFANNTTRRDQEIKEVGDAIQKLQGDNDSQQFSNTINLIFKKENDEITSKVAQRLVQEAIEEVSDTQDQETFDRHKELFNYLNPILTKLGFDNLQANSVEIVKYLQKRLTENKRELSLNKSLFEGIKSWLFPASSRSSVEDKVPSVEDILPRISHQLFERFGEAQLTTPLIKKIMDNLKGKNLRFPPDRENKMSNILSTELSKLNPEGRKGNEDILAQTISEDIISNKGVVLKENQLFNSIAFETIVKKACDKILLPNSLHSQLIPITQNIQGKIFATVEATCVTPSFGQKLLMDKVQPNHLADKNRRIVSVR